MSFLGDQGVGGLRRLPTFLRFARADPERRRLIQRREPRFTVPMYSVQVSVDVWIDDQRYTALLWDISRSGACLRSFLPIPCGGPCLARFHKHASEEIIECRARLVWSETVMKVFFTGLAFDEPITDSTTFLSGLLENGTPKPDRRGPRTPDGEGS